MGRIILKYVGHTVPVQPILWVKLYWNMCVGYLMVYQVWYHSHLIILLVWIPPATSESGFPSKLTLNILEFKNFSGADKRGQMNYHES